MPPTRTTSVHGRSDPFDGHGEEVWREAVTMVLYVSIVLLATLTALPAGGDGDHGPHQLALVGIIWGETLGLTLAHWFAFRLTARGFGHGELSRLDLWIGAAQVAGAAAVAALCTLPVLLATEESAAEVSVVVPALVIGGAGYLASRAAGRPQIQAVVLGVVVLGIGLVIATFKTTVAGH